MEETNGSRLSRSPLLAIVGLAFVVAAIWAATALAGGGSSGTTGSTAGGWDGGTPAPAYVESSEQGAAPSRDDCPERDGSGGDDSSAPDGSSSTTDGV